MKIDVDNPRWLEIIRMCNLITRGVVDLIRISSGGKGLHLYTWRNYQEIIECPERARYREILGYEITFDSKGNRKAGEWFDATINNLFHLLNDLER